MKYVVLVNFRKINTKNATKQGQLLNDNKVRGKLNDNRVGK